MTKSASIIYGAALALWVSAVFGPPVRFVTGGPRSLEAQMQAVNTLNLIGKTVQSYFDGMHFGDTSRLQSAFHPDAFLFGYYHGEFPRLSFEDWMSEVEGMDKPSETGEVFDMVISVN